MIMIMIKIINMIMIITIIIINIILNKGTGQRYETYGASTEGWMTKQSSWLKDWRRRYFILKGSKLFFAKGEHTTPHGMIDLSTCMTVKSAELKAGKKNAIELSTAETTFLMFADTEKDKDEWIGAIGNRIYIQQHVITKVIIIIIGRAIVQASSTFTNDDGVDPDNYNSDSD